MCSEGIVKFYPKAVVLGSTAFHLYGKFYREQFVHREYYAPSPAPNSAFTDLSQIKLSSGNVEVSEVQIRLFELFGHLHRERHLGYTLQGISRLRGIFFDVKRKQ